MPEYSVGLHNYVHQDNMGAGRLPTLMGTTQQEPTNGTDNSTSNCSAIHIQLKLTLLVSTSPLLVPPSTTSTSSQRSLSRVTLGTSCRETRLRLLDFNLEGGSDHKETCHVIHDQPLKQNSSTTSPLYLPIHVLGQPHINM